MSIYEAPELLSNIASSPSKFELAQKKWKNQKKKSFFSNYNYAAVKKSVKWSFVVGTLWAFNCLYHTNGHIYKSLQHGLTGALITMPVKYYFCMDAQRADFFKFVQYSYMTGDETLLKVNESGDMKGRELKYDPEKPYTDSEWEYAQRTYKGTKKYGYGGFGAGVITGISIIYGLRFFGKIRAPFLINLLFVGSCGGFVSVLAMRYRITFAMQELLTWKEEGRLKQEIKQVLTWMNPQKAEQSMQNQVKRKTAQD